MFRTDQPVTGSLELPEALVIEAARAWRAAGEAGDPVQPALHAVLAPEGWEMMAPVLDSLLTLCECRMNRALALGRPRDPSADERLVCGLLAGGTTIELDAPDPAGIDGAFRTAVVSARLMLRAVA